MSAASLMPLLLRARDAGLTLRAEDGYIVAIPKGRLTPKLRDELARHKAELLEFLEWDGEAAVALLKDSAAYLSGPLLITLEHLKETERRALYSGLPEERFFDAHVARDMFAYRIAVRDWVQETKATFRKIERARGRRVPDPRVLSRHREHRVVREGAGAGSAPSGSG